MVKEKKISLTLILNKKLKPLDGEDGIAEYPIYLKLNYDRKNIKFRPNYQLWLYSYETGFEDNPKHFGYVDEEKFEKIKFNFDNDNLPEIPTYSTLKEAIEEGIPPSHEASLTHLLLENKNEIIGLLEKEISLNKDSFSFKGFSKRLDKYFIEVSKLLDDYLSSKFMSELQNKLTSVEKDLFELNYYVLEKYNYLKGIKKSHFLSENTMLEFFHFTHWFTFSSTKFSNCLRFTHSTYFNPTKVEEKFILASESELELNCYGNLFDILTEKATPDLYELFGDTSPSIEDSYVFVCNFVRDYIESE